MDRGAWEATVHGAAKMNEDIDTAHLPAKNVVRLLPTLMFSAKTLPLCQKRDEWECSGQGMGWVILPPGRLAFLHPSRHFNSGIIDSSPS